MRDVFGLVVALTGLFIVWLWATGRIANAWTAIVGGMPGSNTTVTANPTSVNLNPGSLGNMQGMSFDYRPTSYIPTPNITVGGLVMHTP